MSAETIPVAIRNKSFPLPFAVETSVITPTLNATSNTNERGAPPLVAKISKPEDLYTINPNASVIHLTHQRVIKPSILQEITHILPDAQAIQIAPSHQRLISEQLQQSLRQGGIDIRFSRIKNAACYDTRPAKAGYETKKEQFFRRLQEPQILELTNLMRRHGTIELSIALRYFGEPRITLDQLAKELGLTYRCAYDKLHRFLSMIGMETTKNSDKHGTGLVNRLQRLETAEKRKKQQEEAQNKLRERFAVDGRYPPDQLPKQRWLMWQRVNRLIAKYPERIANLKNTDPIAYDCLVWHYQLMEKEGIYKTSRQIGERHGTTRQMVDYYVKRALMKLKKRVTNR